MSDEDKIAEPFREKLKSLKDAETVSALVAIDSDIPAAQRRLSDDERQALIESKGRELDAILTKLQPVISAEGGEVLGVSRPLSMVTIQGPRALFERLSHDESVKAIMENQSITGINSRQ